MTNRLIRALRREIRDAYQKHFERSDRPFRVDLRKIEDRVKSENG